MPTPPPRASSHGHRHRPSRSRQAVRRGTGEDGSASVELAVAAPLLGLLLLTVVQFAVWAHATHIARAAANTGVQTARAYTPSDPPGTGPNRIAQHQGGPDVTGPTATGQGDAARQDAVRVLDQLAGTILTDPRVETMRTATTATVTVTGAAVTVVPGLQLPVRASVTAPRELVPGAP